MRGPGRRSAGLTLLEVIVALAIVGAGVVTVMQVFAGSLRLAGEAARRTEVTLRARALMDELLWRRGEFESTEGEGRTEDGGFWWHWRVRPATAAEDGVYEDEFESDYSLSVVEVSVGWREGGQEKQLDLRALRLETPFG